MKTVFFTLFAVTLVSVRSTDQILRKFIPTSDNLLIMPLLRKRKLDLETEKQVNGKKAKVQKVENIKEELNFEDEEDVKKEISDDENYVDEEYEEFERRRLQNIEDNKKFFESIGMAQAKDDLYEKMEKRKPINKGLKIKKKETEVLPRRSSMRIRRIDPDGLPLPEVPIVPEVPEDEHPRKPAGPLPMADTLLNVDGEEGMKFITNLKAAANQTVKVEKEVQSRDNFVNPLMKLKIKEGHVAKLVPQRIFSLTVHPSETRTLVAVGDKWGKLGMWDVDSKDDQDGVYVFEPHSRPINCLSFQKEHPGKLYSCSYDGVVRCADFEKGIFDEIYATPEDEGIRCSAFDFTSAHTLVVSQSDGEVAFVDIRENSSTVYPIHNKSLKSVSVHPVKPQYFVTACNDGLAHLWDARNMNKKKPKPVDTLNHSRSVNSAYFSPLTGDRILTTSMDDRLRIFDSSDLDNIRLKTTIRHDNHTGRWLTGFRASWHPRRDDLFVVGCMMRPRRIQLYEDTGKIVKEYLDDDLTSVCSINAFHPTRNILVGGNSSGRVSVFS